MKIAWVLLAASTCGTSPRPPGLDPSPTTDAATAETSETTAAAEGEAQPADVAASPADDAGADTPPPGSWIQPPRTVVWAVTTAGCTRLMFQPRPDGSGSIVTMGVRVHYQPKDDWLALGSVSRSEGDGLVARRCYTELRLGPGRTLGGAPVFDDEAACRDALTEATVLDDSVEATAAKCRGETLAVSTREVECGVGHRYAVLAGEPGCITAALEGLGP